MIHLLQVEQVELEVLIILHQVAEVEVEEQEVKVE
jgi:hypothetical protein